MAPPHPTTSIDELAHYSDGELSDAGSEGFEIDPLNEDSLAALRRLVRYKPPKDPYPFPTGRAAVLVALFGSRTGENLNVLLSTRSMSLRTFPGNVALPGGKVDEGDINLEAAARREALEEVGLPPNPDAVRYLTSLPPFVSRNLLLVTPVVVFILDYSLTPDINPAEVSRVFSFPLSGFLQDRADDPSMARRVPEDVARGTRPFHESQDFAWFDGAMHRFHAFQTTPVPVTGLTAEILIAVAEVAYGRAPDFSSKAPGQMESRELITKAMEARERVAAPSGTRVKGKL